MGKITYKIDRLLSGSDGLQLGLKTNVALKPVLLDQSSKYLQITSLAGYSTGLGTFSTSVGLTSDWGSYVESSSSPYATNKNLLTTAAWVEGLTAVRVAYILHYLETSLLVAGDHISITAAQGNADLTPKKKISLVPLYNGSGETVTQNNVKVHTVAPVNDEGNDVAHGTNLTESTKFITGFETDEFGKVTKVYGRKVSTADIGTLTNVDNYRSWGLSVAGYQNGIQIESAYADKNAEQATLTSLTFSGGAAILPTLDSANKIVAFNLQINSDHFTTDAPSQGAQTVLNLKPLSGVEQTTLGLYKTKFDGVGRVIESAAVTSSDITPLLPVFATNTSGIVTAKNSNNTIDATTSTYFLTHEAKWATIPYNKVQVSTTENNKTYSLLGVNGFSSSGLYTTATHTTAYFDKDGIIHGSFAGNGSALTNIIADQIVPGNNNAKINTNVLDAAAIKTLLGIGASLSANQVMITNGSSVMSTIANSISANNNADGYAVLSANMNSSGAIADTPAIGWRNLKSLVSDVVAGEGGMRFQGVIGQGQGENAWTDVSANFKKGDFYKIGTVNSNWDYAGYLSDIEAGDTMIALKDRDASYASASDKKPYWTVIQGNLTNAVTGSNASLNNGTYNIPVANDATMTRIFNSFTAVKSESGWLLNATAAHATDAETLKTSRTLWGQTFNGSQNVTGNMSDVGIITPASGNGITATIGTEQAPWSDAYITAIHGTSFSGEAAHAAALTRPLILTFGDQSFTFDGSATEDSDRTFSFSTDNLNIFDGFENATSGTGNFVTGVTLSRKSGDNSTLVLTAAKGSALTDVTSTLFHITTSGYTRTIAPFTASQGTGSIHFFTDSGNTLPSNTSILKLQGVLLATKLQVAGDSTESTKAAHDVANKRPQTAALEAIDVNKKILVADATSGDYSFIKSTVSIAGAGSITGNWSGASDTTVPTTQAVKNYVALTETAISASTKLECLALPFSASANSFSASSDHPLANNAVIDHIDVTIETSFQAEAGFYLVSEADGSSNTNAIVGADEIDLNTSSGDVFSYKIGRRVGSIFGNSATYRPRINLTGITNTSQGTGVCYIYYTNSQVS